MTVHQLFSNLPSDKIAESVADNFIDRTNYDRTIFDRTKYDAVSALSPSVTNSGAVSNSNFPRISKFFYFLATPLLLMCLMLGASAPVFAADQININEADAETISSSVVGIGPVRAQAIVAYRDQYGKFHRLDDILNVPGIGQITLDSIKPYLSLGETDSSALNLFEGTSLDRSKFGIG